MCTTCDQACKKKKKKKKMVPISNCVQKLPDRSHRANRQQHIKHSVIPTAVKAMESHPNHRKPEF